MFFNNKGHKRLSYLFEKTGKKIRFGGSYETRWSASEKKAIGVIIKNYGPIIITLSDLGEDTSFRAEVRNTASGMAAQMSDKNLMIQFYFMYDILDLLETCH